MSTHNRKKIYLATRIARIRKLCTTISDSKIDLILLLADTHINTHWHTTKYKTLQAFVIKHITGFSYKTILNYTFACVQLINAGYTQTEIKKVYNSIGVSKTTVAANKINALRNDDKYKRKIPVTKLIEAIKKGQFKRTTPTQIISNEDIWRFSLPNEVSRKLESILVQHGLRHKGLRRCNTRQAFMSLIESL